MEDAFDAIAVDEHRGGAGQAEQRPLPHARGLSDDVDQRLEAERRRDRQAKDEAAVRLAQSAISSAATSGGARSCSRARSISQVHKASSGQVSTCGRASSIGIRAKSIATIAPTASHGRTKRVALKIDERVERHQRRGDQRRDARCSRRADRPPA